MYGDSHGSPGQDDHFDPPTAFGPEHPQPLGAEPQPTTFDQQPVPPTDVKVAGEPTQQWSDSEVGELDQYRPRRRRDSESILSRKGVRIGVAAAAVVAVVGGGGAVAMAMGGGGGKGTDAASLPKTHANVAGATPSPNGPELQAQVDQNARNTVLGRASAAAQNVAGGKPKLGVKGAQPTPSSSSSSPGNNSSGGGGYPASSPVTSGQAQAIAVQIMPSFGFDPRTQFNSCLKPMWNNESGWSVTAANGSGAYGIPQALPGSRMASAGSDWRTSAATQIKWGLGYIKDRYGTPCGAWSFWQQHSWY